MKKNMRLTAIIPVILSLLLLGGCGDETSLNTGTSDLSILKMVPKDATGLFFVNIRKFSTLPIYEKMSEDFTKGEKPDNNKYFKSYADFVKKTGVDPKKDLKSVVFFVSGKLDPDNPVFSVIADLKYDREKLVKTLTEKIQGLATAEYLGKKLYKFKEKKEKEAAFSFLSERYISFGSVSGVKKVIDLGSKKTQSVESNKKIMSLLKKVKGNPIFSFVFLIPDEARVVKNAGMFKADLSKAEAVYGDVDYTGMDWTSKIILLSDNREGNEQLKSTLDGLKGLGAMLGPEVAELLNNIEISASAKNLTISISISTELLEKLKKKAEEKMKKGINKDPIHFN